MALRRASRHNCFEAAQRQLYRSYVALSNATYRQAPAPAAFARSEPQSSFNAVLTTPVGGNSLLLENARFLSQQSACYQIHGDTVEETQAQVAATSATYESLLLRLYQVNRFTPTVKLGLENMKKLNAAFGHPALELEVVHVAGTNGKGSVAFKLAKALERSGYKTGLFVSPHVACFRERAQINGTLIPEAEVCELLSEIFNVSAQLRIPATFFEITTMLAFRYFAKHGVDCVVLETGLGGRLDATNIVTPILSVITSIGMDHMQILGNTVEAIACEKAGIIKPNIPVVIGPNTPLNVMREYAAKNNAPLVRVPLGADFEDDYNVENTAIAREACKQLNVLHDAQAGTCRSNLRIDLTDERVHAALESRPPCRFQILHVIRPNSKERKVTVVLDVAHNPPAFERLLSLLHKHFPEKTFRFVCGFSADKAINQVFDKITAVVRGNNPDQSDDEVQKRIHLVKANHPRGASLEEINLAVSNGSVLGQDKRPYASISSIKEGVEAALAASRASADNEVVVVCGSVFLMAEARQVLGLQEPIDSAALTAVAGAGLSTSTSRVATFKQEGNLAAAT
ncbi:hypothetical protein PsorP6_016585 [Peronosclerospora sorghi]|uniref:Uncharacterized protein n=1 Tax=Peronosclerospora sorghi TaxID=230839 RepID=A0ACC0VJ79_9STRA|nr:hypothetical protein PsorP6_016585 [Peronosclerospora sorghi]